MFKNWNPVFNEEQPIGGSDTACVALSSICDLTRKGNKENKTKFCDKKLQNQKSSEQMAHVWVINAS